MSIVKDLKEYIPQGDGYNSHFAHTLTAAVEEIETLREALKSICATLAWQCFTGCREFDNEVPLDPAEAMEKAVNALKPNVKVSGCPPTKLEGSEE